MTTFTQLSEDGVEELQDLSASSSQDHVQITTHSTVQGRYSVTSAKGTTACHYGNVPSVSGSTSRFDPIQALQSSYDLRRIGSHIRGRHSGWKIGMIMGISADLAILVLVLSLTVFTALNFPRRGYQATLIDKNCDSVRSWSTWRHLGVNVVCTVLLATSSYAVQCLTSPTRNDINRVHQRSRCIDFGVPSFRNLLCISPRRVLLWLVLLLSSIPLHLLANSAVYEIQGANSYVLAVVEEDFLSRPLSRLGQGYVYAGAGLNSGYYTDPQPSWVDQVTVNLYQNTTRLLKELVPRMERLENAECMRAYSQPLQVEPWHGVGSHFGQDQAFKFKQHRLQLHQRSLLPELGCLSRLPILSLLH